MGAAIVAALQRPSSLDWLYAFGSSFAGRKGPVLTTQECKARAEEFGRMVSAERLYAQDGVTLSVAAKRLGVPARRLSESINRVHGESYSRHMNRLRVESAKHLLRRRPDKAMIDVMYEAGFRTKSSFNREFRALEGVSPTEYRQRADALR